MHNLEHAYPYNTNVMPNPVDTRTYPLLRSGGGKRGKRGSRGSRCKGGKKYKYKNYTGRQIGCRSRHSNTRSRRRSRSRSSRSRSRSRMQSGGDIVNNLPMDASMIVQSATKLGGDLWHGLQGTPSVNSSPFPFLDQGIKESTAPETALHSQTGGGSRGGFRRKRCRGRDRKSRRASSKRYSSRRPQQSGGDIFSYLPFDMSTTIRSAANSVGNALSSTKGLPGSVSPLPYNDHALQKPELKASDHLPDLQKYYRNANLSIPSL